MDRLDEHLSCLTLAPDRPLRQASDTCWGHEPAFERVLANPAHIKNVPGRKTDVKDAEWVDLPEAAK